MNCLEHENYRFLKLQSLFHIHLLFFHWIFEGDLLTFGLPIDKKILIFKEMLNANKTSNDSLKIISAVACLGKTLVKYLQDTILRSADQCLAYTSIWRLTFVKLLEQEEIFFQKLLKVFDICSWDIAYTTVFCSLPLTSFFFLNITLPLN